MSEALRTTVVIVTLVTFVTPIVPLPLATLQFCAARAVTVYAVPSASPAVNVKLPGALAAR